MLQGRGSWPGEALSASIRPLIRSGAGHHPGDSHHRSGLWSAGVVGLKAPCVMKPSRWATLWWMPVRSLRISPTSLSNHAAELLGREETQQLVDHVAKDAPKLVEDSFPRWCRSISCRRFCRTCSPKACTSAIFAHHRNPGRAYPYHPGCGRSDFGCRLGRLGQTIVGQLYGNANELPVMTLSQAGANPDQRRTIQGRRPGARLGRKPAGQHRAQAERVEQQRPGASVADPAALRPLLAISCAAPCRNWRCWHNEIPDNKTIRIISVVGGREALMVRSFWGHHRDAPQTSPQRTRREDA